MSRTEDGPLYDDNPWADADTVGEGAASNRMSPTMRGSIIIVALVAVIAIAAAVIAVALRGGVGDEPGSATASESATETEVSSPETETTEETPAVDSAAMLEGAGFDVVMSGPAPDAVERWGDFELVRSTNERVRVVEGSGPSRATLDGGQWPMTMNSCGAVTYLVVFRGVNENVSLNASLLNSAYLISAEERTSQGWMLLTNCATPQWEFLGSADQGNLGDVVYDVHEYRQSATASGGSPADAPVTDVAAEPTVVRCLEGTPGPALWSDGTMDFAQECVETPEAQRSLMGERCCGGLYGRQECGEELWQELCNSGPPQ